MESFYYQIFMSPVGPLGMVASEKGLVALEFARGQFPGKRDSNVVWKHSTEPTRECAVQLEQYFAGARREFTLPLDLRGTPFQLRCWRALLKIPYGETRTYADNARAVGCTQG